MISPQVALPTSPTPSASAISPTLRGLEKWSHTLSEYIIVVLSFLYGKYQSFSENGRKQKVLSTFSKVVGFKRAKPFVALRRVRNTMCISFLCLCFVSQGRCPQHILCCLPLQTFVYEKPVENLFSITKNFYFYSS